MYCVCTLGWAPTSVQMQSCRSCAHRVGQPEAGTALLDQRGIHSIVPSIPTITILAPRFDRLHPLSRAAVSPVTIRILKCSFQALVKDSISYSLCNFHVSTLKAWFSALIGNSGATSAKNVNFGAELNFCPRFGPLPKFRPRLSRFQLWIESKRWVQFEAAWWYSEIPSRT